MIPSSAFKLVSMYTRHSPLKRGKGRLINLLLNSGMSNYSCLTKSKDGRLFEFVSSSKLNHQIYFYGEREPEETFIVKRIVEPGDTAFDIGANIGWYTTLFSRLVGEKGRVFAVEPVPGVFASLERTIELNYCFPNIRLFNNLCGEKAGQGIIYEFPNLHPGLSSSKPIGNEERIEHCLDVITIDGLIARNGLSGVDVLKIDVEGAEFSVLKEAADSLKSGKINAILIEVNFERARAFGYDFVDCLLFIGKSNHYNFYRILQNRAGLQELGDLSSCKNGENLLILLTGSKKQNCILSGI